LAVVGKVEIEKDKRFCLCLGRAYCMPRWLVGVSPLSMIPTVESRIGLKGGFGFTPGKLLTLK